MHRLHVLMQTIILPQKVATGTAYACLLRELKLCSYNPHLKFDLKEVSQYQMLRDFLVCVYLLI